MSKGNNIFLQVIVVMALPNLCVITFVCFLQIMCMLLLEQKYQLFNSYSLLPALPPIFPSQLPPLPLKCTFLWFLVDLA